MTCVLIAHPHRARSRQSNDRPLALCTSAIRLPRMTTAMSGNTPQLTKTRANMPSAMYITQSAFDWFRLRRIAFTRPATAEPIIRRTPSATPAIGASPPPSPIPFKNHARLATAKDIPNANISHRRLAFISPLNQDLRFGTSNVKYSTLDRMVSEPFGIRQSLESVTRLGRKTSVSSNGRTSPLQ